jgi:sugar phosphate isomerase/epimerase
MGLFHTDLAVVHRTIGFDGLGRLLDDNGIARLELEFLTDWWTDGPRRVESDRWRTLLFDAAAALGVEVVKIAPDLGGADVDLDLMQHAFDEVADRAAAAGCRVALEPMPFSNIRTVPEAVRFVTEVGNAAGGLALDSWHSAKGGTAHEELVDLLPVESLFIVELADGTVAGSGSLADDAIEGRLDPGEGELDVAGFVAAVHRAGYRGPWGVEIMSAAHRGSDVVDALRTTFERTRSVLEAAEECIGGPVGRLT